MTPGRRVDRVMLMVCDSFGVGAAPDAAAYGDAGTNTLGHVADAVGGLDAPSFSATPARGHARARPAAGCTYA